MITALGAVVLDVGSLHFGRSTTRSFLTGWRLSGQKLKITYSLPPERLFLFCQKKTSLIFPDLLYSLLENEIEWAQKNDFISGGRKNV